MLTVKVGLATVVVDVSASEELEASSARTQAAASKVAPIARRIVVRPTVWWRQRTFRLWQRSCEGGVGGEERALYWRYIMVELWQVQYLAFFELRRGQ